MLCPEVWNFKAPGSAFITEKMDETKCPAKSKINNFHFNHLVNVFVPDLISFPNNLKEKLTLDCEYYKIVKLNLSDLINMKFLNYFVRNGKLTLLSVNTKIDCDNCIGIVPSGQLVLSVNKDTYHSLGLEGKVSHFAKKTKKRYVIMIDLKQENLKPQKAIFTKLKSHLLKLGKFTVIMNWEPPEKSICPSSIAKYFSDLGYDVTVCMPTLKSHTVYSVHVPLINLTLCDDNNVKEFAEWLGMISIDGDLGTQNPGNYITSYVTPEPTIKLGQVKCIQWRGFFTTTKISELIDDLILWNKSVDKLWISVYVQGFSDAPTAWGLEEHHYYTNGDNSYLLIFNKNTFLRGFQKSSQKYYKNK